MWRDVNDVYGKERQREMVRIKFSTVIVVINLVIIGFCYRIVLELFVVTVVVIYSGDVGASGEDWPNKSLVIIITDLHAQWAQ